MVQLLILNLLRFAKNEVCDHCWIACEWIVSANVRSKLVCLTNILLKNSFCDANNEQNCSSAFGAEKSRTEDMIAKCFMTSRWNSAGLICWQSNHAISPYNNCTLIANMGINQIVSSRKCDSKTWLSLLSWVAHIWCQPHTVLLQFIDSHSKNAEIKPPQVTLITATINPVFLKYTRNVMKQPI